MKHRVDGWTWLDVRAWNPLDVERLKDDLTIIPKQNKKDKSPPRPIHLYHQNGTHLGIPRESRWSKRLAELGRLDPQVSPGVPLNLQLNPGYALRDDQPEALEKFVNAFNGQPFGGGILQAKGAWGKTAFCAFLAERIQCSMMVVVFRDFFLEQWREEMEKFLVGVRVGFVQQDRCEFRDRDIVIAMIHSLAQRDYPEELYRWPGILVCDEVHVTGAQTWSVVAPRFSSRFRLGLSATPRRKDGAEDAFRLHIGNILFESKTARMTGLLKRVFTDWYCDKGKPDYVAMRIMVKSTKRNRLIMKYLTQAIDAGRKCLVFSGRLNHIGIMEEMLRELRPECQQFSFIGGVSMKKMKAVQDKVQVIFATFQKASAGWNIEDADALFLTTPVGDVEQAYYRITRWLKGKKEPIIVEFIDEYFWYLWKMRQEFYQKFGLLRD